MNKRIAKKIVKTQIITCKIYIDSPETIITGGRKDFGESKYQKALNILFRGKS